MMQLRIFPLSYEHTMRESGEPAGIRWTGTAAFFSFVFHVFAELVVHSFLHFGGPLLFSSCAIQKEWISLTFRDTAIEEKITLRPFATS